IYNRFKTVFGVKLDREVAALFGIDQGDFSRRKSRGTLLELMIDYGHDRKVNLHWLLTGEGAPRIEEARNIEADVKENAELGSLLSQAKKVLTSGNEQAVDALEKNIKYFAHAIEVERRLSRLEKEMEAIKALIGSKRSPEAGSPQEEAI
ncbi:MAG: helix-turn-helix domain-containing protein, partial [Syntrophobacteraceae bacterium]|nr:helix-turn-helix domain-containing protein [Syntrophobacteraceae bacterium]